jgi:hypothetical protein
VEPIFIDNVRKIFRVLRSNLEAQSLAKFLTNCGTLLNNDLLPHRFFKELMKSYIILKGLKPTKIKGYEETLRAEAYKIKHHHFKELFYNVIRGKMKLKKRSEVYGIK